MEDSIRILVSAPKLEFLRQIYMLTVVPRVRKLCDYRLQDCSAPHSQAVLGKGEGVLQ